MTQLAVEQPVLNLEQDAARARELAGLPHIQMSEHLRQAQRLLGVGQGRMFREMAELAAGPGLLTPSEYLIYRLFDPSMPAKEKRRFIGKKMQYRAHVACTGAPWRAISRDKLVFYGLMQSLGFPVPKLVALYHPDRTFANSSVLRTAEALMDFLRSIDRPLFAKPVDGMYSIGCLAIEKAEVPGTVRLAFGQTASADQVARYVQGRPGGYLFQEHLRPHPALARLSGPAASTIRMLVFLGPDGPELVSALWKIPKGRNVADNFWRGNLLGALDPESGRIVRAVSGVGMNQILHRTHPDTGEVLVGAALPHWADALRSCLEAAVNLPGLRTQSWDIAITDRGPVLIEVNWGGDLNLPQIAHGRGLLDDRYETHLQRCGFGRHFLPERLANPLARRVLAKGRRLYSRLR